MRTAARALSLPSFSLWLFSSEEPREFSLRKPQAEPADRALLIQRANGWSSRDRVATRGLSAVRLLDELLPCSPKSIDVPHPFLDHGGTPAVPRLLCPEAIDAKWIFLKNSTLASRLETATTLWNRSTTGPVSPRDSLEGAMRTSLSFVRCLSPLLVSAPFRCCFHAPSRDSRRSTQIDYTGSLYGYYRMEYNEPDQNHLPPVKSFLDYRKADPSRLLLSMGDNFGPEFGAAIQLENLNTPDPSQGGCSSSNHRPRHEGNSPREPLQRRRSRRSQSRLRQRAQFPHARRISRRCARKPGLHVYRAMAARGRPAPVRR